MRLINKIKAIDIKEGSLLKVIRLGIVVLSFLCLTNINGMPIREAHQFLMLCTCITLFALLLDNIWVSLFLAWTVFLFIYFKFRLGHVYLINIFFGCFIYYITKISFKKRHINLFINAVLWLTFLNVGYMILQVMGFDFIYKGREIMPDTSLRLFMNDKEVGFMGNLGYIAILIALAVPLLFTRQGRWAKIGAGMLFIPLVVTRTFMGSLAAVAGFLFVSFFYFPRKAWVVVVILVCILGMAFYIIVDKPGFERLEVWKLALQDANYHPITGWGLDSWRNITEKKGHIYCKGLTKSGNKWHMSIWDNPHNLIISLIMEFGIFGVLILIGYVRQCVLWFKSAIKEPNTIALGAVILVFFIASMAHFPMFLARQAVLFVPLAALFEVSTRG